MDPNKLLEPEILPYSLGFATVLATIIGAFISGVIVRSHKVATFRQDWINSVRKTFSSILSQLDLYIDVAYQKNEEAYREKIKLTLLFDQARLYLNKEEKTTINLLEILNPIPEDYFGRKDGRLEFGDQREKISEIMQEILKTEWNRVRDGEAIWRIKNFFKWIKRFLYRV